MLAVDVFVVMAVAFAVLAFGFSCIALSRRASGPASGPAIERKLATIDQGRKIQAIKLYRKQTGVGLKEAKDAVEELARQRGL